MYLGPRQITVFYQETATTCTTRYTWLASTFLTPPKSHEMVIRFFHLSGNHNYTITVTCKTIALKICPLVTEFYSGQDRRHTYTVGNPRLAQSQLWPTMITRRSKLRMPTLSTFQGNVLFHHI